jgi:hypothetical protein
VLIAGAAALAPAACAPTMGHRATGSGDGVGDGAGGQRHTTGVTTVLPAGTSASALRAASRAFFASSPVVVLAGDETSHPAAARVAAHLGVPVLLPDAHLLAELDRLGVSEIVSFAAQPPPGDLRVVPGPAEGTPRLNADLPAPPPAGRALLLIDPDQPASPLVRATATAAGAGIVEIRGADPRADADAIAALRAAPEATVAAVGRTFGSTERFAGRIRTARLAPELPSGGLLALPANHYVAIYGNPLTPSLGLLGEQDATAAVTRVGDLVAQYADLLDTPVRPAFELIATVAASAPGSDGSYSTPTDPAVLARWIDVAEGAGVYCLLDLQPGRSDFLTQARLYADLLRRPGVGLALDPEWRLLPGELPLTRIGHVDAAEVNAVADWLATLTRENDLPPKMLVLHQFQTQMLRDRDQIDRTHDELQIVVHVDGSGGQGAKQSTWRTMRADLPDGFFLGWKNFIDEDAPMLTPPETVAQVTPFPSLISYQ